MPSLQDLNDDFAIMDALPEGDALSLGAPSTVEEILRGWVAFLLDLSDRIGSGEIEDAAAQAELQGEAERLQGIFFGGQPEAFKGTAWNSPAQLGAYLTGPVGLEATREQAVVGLLRAFWTEANKSILAFKQEKLSEEALITELDDLVDRYGYYLRGAPFPDDYFDDEAA